MSFDITILIEFASAILILLGFEYFNRKDIKGFYVMAFGQLLATFICAKSELWFLSVMHLINFLMQIRGWLKWQKDHSS